MEKQLNELNVKIEELKSERQKFTEAYVRIFAEQPWIKRFSLTVEKGFNGTEYEPYVYIALDSDKVRGDRFAYAKILFSGRVEAHVSDSGFNVDITDMEKLDFIAGVIRDIKVAVADIRTKIEPIRALYEGESKVYGRLVEAQGELKSLGSKKERSLKDLTLEPVLEQLLPVTSNVFERMTGDCSKIFICNKSDLQVSASGGIRLSNYITVERTNYGRENWLLNGSRIAKSKLFSLNFDGHFLIPSALASKPRSNWVTADEVLNLIELAE